jgi:TPR repeat protein
MYLGDDAYQKYDDSSFRKEFSATINARSLVEHEASTLYNLGTRYHHGDRFMQDKEQARLYYDLAAKKGHSSAPYNLGMFFFCFFVYDIGQGVDQDFNIAKHYYERAAENGDSSSEYNLGSLYYHFLGGVVDDNKARHYFELAAEQRDTDAHVTLA